MIDSKVNRKNATTLQVALLFSAKKCNSLLLVALVGSIVVITVIICDYYGLMRNG